MTPGKRQGFLCVQWSGTCSPVGPASAALAVFSPHSPSHVPSSPSHLSSSSQSSPPQRSRNSLVFMPPILSRSDL